MSKKQEKELSLTERLTQALPDKLKFDRDKAHESAQKEKALAEEQYFQVDEEHPDKSIYVKPVAKPTTDAAVKTPSAPLAKSAEIQEIEEILGAGLEQVYQGLDAREQAEFKRKGEEVATKIDALLGKVKVKAKEILSLIKAWLLSIPKINRFFLEQECKIKTDQIMALAKKNKQK